MKQVQFTYEISKKNPGLAVVFELIGGFFQVFGVGNIIAGDVVMGLLLMFGYVVLQTLNLILSFVGVGLITGPLTWVLFMVISPMLASNAVKKQNRQLLNRLREAGKEE